MGNESGHQEFHDGEYLIAYVQEREWDPLYWFKIEGKTLTDRTGKIFHQDIWDILIAISSGNCFFPDGTKCPQGIRWLKSSVAPDLEYIRVRREFDKFKLFQPKGTKTWYRIHDIDSMDVGGVKFKHSDRLKKIFRFFGELARGSLSSHPYTVEEVQVEGELE